MSNRDVSDKSRKNPNLSESAGRGWTARGHKNPQLDIKEDSDLDESCRNGGCELRLETAERIDDDLGNARNVSLSLRNRNEMAMRCGTTMVP